MRAERHGRARNFITRALSSIIRHIRSLFSSPVPLPTPLRTSIPSVLQLRFFSLQLSLFVFCDLYTSEWSDLITRDMYTYTHTCARAHKRYRCILYVCSAYVPGEGQGRERTKRKGAFAFAKRWMQLRPLTDVDIRATFRGKRWFTHGHLDCNREGWTDNAILRESPRLQTTTRIV